MKMNHHPSKMKKYLERAILLKTPPQNRHHILNKTYPITRANISAPKKKLTRLEKMLRTPRSYITLQRIVEKLNTFQMHTYTHAGQSTIHLRSESYVIEIFKKIIKNSNYNVATISNTSGILVIACNKSEAGSSQREQEKKDRKFSYIER